jgi:hypothetical protein
VRDRSGKPLQRSFQIAAGLATYSPTAQKKLIIARNTDALARPERKTIQNIINTFLRSFHYI